ncbi:MAG: cysteine--tRNA ligase [Candidatus Omnitrophota bacterium]
MPIHIYNSLSRRKEILEPLNSPWINMYTCGVTVYDESHIGHARSLYVFDVIRGYLEYRGFKVNFARNITDIDDKIINRANELKTNWEDLVNKYIDRYYEDLESLGVRKGTHEPRATENIADMIKYIQALIDKGYAYESGGDVYFNVRKFSGYGKLSGQSIDQMEAGARIELCDLKKDHLDFALWKKSKENEPWWDSPWGKGRPGWHIECSVMSRKFLETDTLDIHAGGRDLIFPHHENETAQAEAFSGKPFAKYWIHHGLLTINGQKMSKSLGNFITIKDFMAKHKDADILKMFFLSAHYSQPMDYNEARIEEAKEALVRIVDLIQKVENVKFIDEGRGAKDESKTNDRRHKSDKKIEEIESIKDKFIGAMNDDFNTPRALAAIFELVSLANKNINDLVFISKAKTVLFELKDILGLDLMKMSNLMKRHTASITSDAMIAAGPEELEITKLVGQRDQAKKKKDYKKADKIRKELEDRGIILEDTKEGTVWRRKL